LPVYADIAVAIVALLHLGFFVLETFLWNTPRGHRWLHLKPEFAGSTAILAANQGVYNALLATGLIWSFFSASSSEIRQLILAIILLAGLYGGITTSRVILWLQALPGLIALVLVFLAQS